MLSLTPAIASLTEGFLSERHALERLVAAHGSPLNIVFPQMISENATALRSVLKKHGIRGSIHFAHKANKSRALVKQVLADGLSIDTASETELKHALSCGFTAEHIELTGPKDERFLLLGLRHGCLISIDSLAELEEIFRLAEALHLSKPVRILVRVSGFQAGNRESRFGIAVSDFTEVIRLMKNKSNVLDFRGLAFHLDTVSMKEKLQAVDTCLSLLAQCRSEGLQPSILNMGGGLRVNYLKHREEWNAYTTALQEGALGKREPLTWNNTSMGWRGEKGVLQGGQNYADFYVDPSGADYLDALLSMPLPSHEDLPIGQYLSEHMIDLLIEPGRALLDQAGITVAEVTFTKRSQQGDHLVGLSMNRSNLWSFEQEIFMDPIVLHKEPANEQGEYGTYFIGNLCLENDFLFRHKTFLPSLPKKGDLVVFANTAGYFMDFAESATIQQRIADKVAVVKKGDEYHWFKDDIYEPLIHLADAV